MVATEDENKHQTPQDDQGEDAVIEEQREIPQQHQEKEEVAESTTNVTTSASSNHDEKADIKPHAAADGDLPPMQQLTVEELYDKDKYDLSTMEPGDVFVLLQ
jgi:hypothetical protein